jgi:hypothetical protein
MRFHPFWQFKPSTFLNASKAETIGEIYSSFLGMNNISINTNIKLNETEKEIFKLLRDCVSDTNLPVTLRVAGGWVRDKVGNLGSIFKIFTLTSFFCSVVGLRMS